jgi:hypothetical protein
MTLFWKRVDWLCGGLFQHEYQQVQILNSQPRFSCEEQYRKIPAVNQYISKWPHLKICAAVSIFKHPFWKKTTFFKISTNIDAQIQYWYT